MGYQRGSDRYGDNDRSGGGDRWRERDNRSGERGSGGYDRGARDWSGGRPHGDDDRGFFERAGDEVRSWFGDDDDRDRHDRGRQDPGRSGDRGGYARGGGSSWGGSPDSQEVFGEPGQGGASGFGGSPDRGRRFDRIDAGSTGTHGAHPMSSPVGGAYGAGYGISAGGGYGGSSARESAAIGGGHGRTSGGGDIHDRNYSEWRNRQIDQLDRDYDDYRREHQSRFEQEFGGWREKRQGQRQSMGRVSEHMEVVGSDGEHVGVVDHVRQDRIILARNDENAGGHHHSIPCSWIDKVDDKVVIDKSSDDARKAWKDEETNRALFERRDQGSEGPHVLNRSFSGTY